jgi:hypothetical protein
MRFLLFLPTNYPEEHPENRQRGSAITANVSISRKTWFKAANCKIHRIFRVFKKSVLKKRCRNGVVKV